MRKQAIRLLMLVVVGVVSLSALSTAIARADTKLSGEVTGWVGTPMPEDCIIDHPIKAEDFSDALDKGVAAEPDPNAIPWHVLKETELPKGKDVDSEVLDAVSATLWASTGCLNAGDFGRFLAYFSPEGQFQFISIVLEALGADPHAITDKQLTEIKGNIKTTLAEPPKPSEPEDQGRIDKIRDARVLNDMRVLIVIDGTVAGEGTAYSILRKIENQWFIDAIGIIGDLPATGL
jgi:hypothetical protein